MINISWLESIAKTTDRDVDINNILKAQPKAIQVAYRSNDSSALNILIGGTNKLADKNTVFQL